MFREKVAAVYYKLEKHSHYRLMMLLNGGNINPNDTATLWNTALISEIEDVPAFTVIDFLNLLNGSFSFHFWCSGHALACSISLISTTLPFHDISYFLFFDLTV